MHNEVSDYVRDEKSKALLKVDRKGLQEYLSKREQINKIKQLENDVVETKSDIKEIKALLMQLLEKNG